MFLAVCTHRLRALVMGGLCLVGGLLPMGRGLVAQHNIDTTMDLRPALTAGVLNQLWAADSIAVPGGSKIARRVVGFNGPDYQRFDIRIISIIRVSDSLPVFSVQGKTRFQDTVRAFAGLAALAEARAFPAQNGVKSGFLRARLRFTDSDSGYFEGEITTYVLLEEGEIRYDALFFAHPSFSNNLCTGLYRKGNAPVKPCRWGDFRVPDCGDLDVGIAQFVPNARYYPYGWERYVSAWLYTDDTPGATALKAEEILWWKK